MPPDLHNPNHFRSLADSVAPVDGIRRWHPVLAIRDTHRPWSVRARCPTHCSERCVRKAIVRYMDSCTLHRCRPGRWGSHRHRGTRAPRADARSRHRDCPMAFARDSDRRHDAAAPGRLHSGRTGFEHKDSHTGWQRRPNWRRNRSPSDILDAHSAQTDLPQGQWGNGS